MSAALRQAVRDFIVDLEDTTPIDPASRVGQLRRLLRLEERAATPPEPMLVRQTDLERARFVEALGTFKKSTGHFVGCGADKSGGLCSAACRQAQLALDPELVGAALTTVDLLQRTINALQQERRELQRTIGHLETQAGLVKRPRGRPRKRPEETTTTSVPHSTH